MTDVSSRTVTRTWREITMPNPTVRSELYLALHLAEQEYETVHGREADSDNAFTVYADDEQIVIQFELPKKEG